MFVRESGSAQSPCVLLLAGQIYSSELYAPLWNLLGETRRVLVPDLPGNGQSPLLRPYSFDAVIEALEQELIGRNINEVAVCGYSLGGYLAMSLALRGKVRVTRLALVAALAGMDAEAKAQFAEYSRLLRAGSDIAEQIVPGLHLSAGYLAAHPEAAAQVIAALRALSKETFASECWEASRMRDLRPSLSTLAAPSLVIAGAEDQACTPASCNAIASALPHGAFELVPNAGHQLFMEQGPWLTARLAEFFLSSN